MTQMVIMAAYLGLLVGLGAGQQPAFPGNGAGLFPGQPLDRPGAAADVDLRHDDDRLRAGRQHRRGLPLRASASTACWPRGRALVHSAVFFFVGIRLWAIGKRYGYVTQIQFFRDRFESDDLGLLLFPILVGLVIPYLLVGLLGARGVVRSLTVGAFPELFASTGRRRAALADGPGDLRRRADLHLLRRRARRRLGQYVSDLRLHGHRRRRFRADRLQAGRRCRRPAGACSRCSPERLVRARRDVAAGFLHLLPDPALGRHVPARLPALADGALGEDLPADRHRAPDVHPDRLDCPAC